MAYPPTETSEGCGRGLLEVNVDRGEGKSKAEDRGLRQGRGMDLPTSGGPKMTKKERERGGGRMGA